MKCLNKYGNNPCGPDGACKDTKTGYSCTPLLKVFNDCAMGCGPNSYCVAITSTRKMCLCKSGFHRNAPHLPCVKTPKK